MKDGTFLDLTGSATTGVTLWHDDMLKEGGRVRKRKGRERRGRKVPEGLGGRGQVTVNSPRARLPSQLGSAAYNLGGLEPVPWPPHSCMSSSVKWEEESLS